jgi:hypothetical protein
VVEEVGAQAFNKGCDRQRAPYACDYA